jgi:glucosamine-6-phosphate deaminase
VFHMDEYIGYDSSHPQSFRRYLREHFLDHVEVAAFHAIQGESGEPHAEAQRYDALIRRAPIDIVCLGFGENGHLAFNDPPVAKFDDPHFVKLVKLDDICKMQQVKQGHFPSLEAVNPYAFTLTIPALCSARKMLCLAPETRKAGPVRNMLEGPISPACPASVLRTQTQATLFLDTESAAGLDRPVS